MGESEYDCRFLIRLEAENVGLRSEVMRLRGQQSAVRDMAVSDADDLRQENAAKDARIADLVAALRPFAQGTMISYGDGVAMLITEEHIGKARAALQAAPKEGDGAGQR